ncbi:orotate phosphoribosyltransferase [Eisenibacter elegans]|uniref:orotate phosphoribosyltransferase n=1 Tax=Eisenibacter elegans TaxID=997 RepID=UPI00040A0B13|nr:orotate phosphoribosyltransferase [Eisenibacter elegans]
MSTHIANPQIASEIAKYLLEVDAVRVQPEQPFRWSSGWLAPIYCDSRLTISYPEVRSKITESFVNIIRERFPQVEAIAGVATAGIPQSALIAGAMGLPLVYVRSKPKGHGMANLLEGKVESAQKVVVVEDVVSTGGSSLQAVEALREAGVQVIGLVAIFSYAFQQTIQRFAEAQVTHYTLSDYPSLLELYKTQHQLSPEIASSLNAWRKAPEQWQGPQIAE